MLNHIIMKLNTVVERVRPENLRSDAGNVSSSRSNVQEGAGRIGNEIQSLDGGTVDMRGRNMHIAFFQGLVRVCDGFIALTKITVMGTRDSPQIVLKGGMCLSTKDVPR